MNYKNNQASKGIEAECSGELGSCFESILFEIHAHQKTRRNLGSDEKESKDAYATEEGIDDWKDQAHYGESSEGLHAVFERNADAELGCGITFFFFFDEYIRSYVASLKK